MMKKIVITRDVKFIDVDKNLWEDIISSQTKRYHRINQEKWRLWWVEVAHEPEDSDSAKGIIEEREDPGFFDSVDVVD